MQKLKIFAAQIRLETLKIIASRGFGHVGGSMSMADAMAVLYGDIMNIDPQKPRWEGRDWFVLSKGHGGPVMYATLGLKGYYPMESAYTLNQPGTDFPSHTDRNKTIGVDLTTGSLGQGMSEAVGAALGSKVQGRKNHVFVAIGDGEADEGQVWEAAQFAAHYKLDNLICLVDDNKRQLDGWTEDIYPMGDYVAKFEAFGFDTVKVDGNDVEAVAEALANIRQGGGRPHAVILDTVKGAGIREVEDTAMNHSLTVSDEQFERWTAQLKAQLAELEG